MNRTIGKNASFSSGQLFLKRAAAARKKIAKSSNSFIKDGAVGFTDDKLN